MLKKKSVAFADISIIEPVSLILFSSPWCSRDGHRGGRTWKDIDENTEEKKWYIWYIRVAKIIYLIYRDGRAGIMYLIYKGDKDYVFDIEGWQRFELTCAPQGCRRSDGKTWPRCPEPRRQVTCKLAKISDKVFVGKNLFKVFYHLTSTSTVR